MNLGLLLFGLAGLCVPQTRPAVTHEFRISLSVSPFTELVFGAGITFTDGQSGAANPEELQRMFVKYGANEVYARIATTRAYRSGFGDHSLNRGLERARLAKALDLPFNPELGLFDIYGDVRCQPSPDFRDYPQLKLPGPWTSLKLEQMLPILRSYGAIAAREILKTGVEVRIWDLGNEVEFGTAGVAVRPMPGGCDDTAGGPGWYKPPDRVDPAIGKMSVPDLMKLPEAERIAWLQARLWPHLARMFAAVAAGIKSVDPNARFSTHASGVTSVIPAQAVAFYQALKAGGFFPDELGFSFYPSSSDKPPYRLRVFERTMETVHRELGRPVFIAEFGYPSALLAEGPFAGWNFATERYPLTAQGQANMLHDVAAWAAASGVSGIRPWAPELVLPGWEPFALFGLHGKSASANAGLSALGDGVPTTK